MKVNAHTQPLHFSLSVSVSVSVSVCVCVAGDGLCLRWSHFEQAMKGFTPPSLWGVRLETPPGVGLDRVGGLKEVRKELMDTVLLPAKVSQSEPLAVTRPLHEAASCPLYRGQWASSSRSETWSQPGVLIGSP